MATDRNSKRAKRIATALATVKEYDGARDWQATIIDALADLRHLCDEKGLDFEHLDSVALDHCRAEHGAAA